MYQATCDYCGRVHSSKKLETLPQTCNSCHAVLPAPEWIGDDETSLDDIKDAVREVLDERDRSNGSKPVHVIKSEPKYTKQEEKLMQLTNALEDKTDKVKTKISGDIRYCKKPIKDAIEKTKILPDNGDDPMTGWTFIKILIAPVVVGLLLFFMAKLHILYAFTGAMIAVFSALIIMNLPLPWLNRKKLAEQANNDYQEAAKEYDALLKDYEISCSQITRYMSENKTYIRKDMIITTKKHMISWQTDIKKEQQYYNADTLNEEINDMFKCLRWKRAICFIVPVLLLIVSFLCINLERTNTPTEQKVVTGTVASKDINTNTFVIKDSQGREKSFCIRDNDTFWKYTVGDEISVEFNTYESGRKEYRLYENGYTTNIELTET